MTTDFSLEQQQALALASARQRQAQGMSFGDAAARETGIFGRAVGPTLAGAGTGAAIGSMAGPVGTAGGAVIGGIVGSMPGGVMDRGVNYIADKLHAAQPETGTEKTMSAVDQAIAGSLTGIGAGGAIKGALQAGEKLPELSPYVAKLLADKPVAQVAGAVGAGTLGSIAQQNGAGPLTQIGAGLVGGIAGHQGVSLPAGIIGAVTNSGARIEKGVGNLLYNQALDPHAAISASRAPEQYVPGSNPTTAQATLDPGLINLEKGVRQFPNQSPVFTGIMNDQNTARQNLLTSVAGTPESLQGLRDERNNVTGPMREAAFNSFDNDTRKIQPQRPAFVQDVRQNLLPFGETNWSNKTTQQKLADVLQGYGYDVRSNPNPDGKGTLYSATKLNPATQEPITINYRAGANPEPGNYIDLAHPDQGINALAKKVIKSEPFRPVVNKQAPLGVITDTLNSPDGNNFNVRKAMVAAQDEISKANNIQDPRYAYPVKKSLQEAAQAALDPNKTMSGSSRLAAGMMSPVMSSLDDQIDQATNGLYKPYLEQYSAMSKPINQSELLQEIQQGGSAQGGDIHGNRVLQQVAFGRQLQNNAPDIAKTLTSEQQSVLGNIKSDLDRAQTAANVPGQAVGSDTIRNKLMVEMLGKYSTLADSKALGLIPGAKPVANWLMDETYTKPALSKLASALQNPADYVGENGKNVSGAASLMSAAAKRQQEIKNTMMLRALYGNISQPLMASMGSRQ